MKKFFFFLIALSIAATPVLAAKGDVSVTYAYIHVNITNKAPSITSLELNPSPIYEDTDVECVAKATDREKDFVEYHYNWYRNGQDTGFSERVLPSEYFSADDKVMCEATPYDRYYNGTSARASAVVLAVPMQTKIVKTALATAGVERSTTEVASVVQKGMAATTGYVVREVGQSSAAPVGLLIIAIGFLVVVNLNLLLRIARRKKQVV